MNVEQPSYLLSLAVTTLLTVLGWVFATRASVTAARRGALEQHKLWRLERDIEGIETVIETLNAAAVQADTLLAAMIPSELDCSHKDLVSFSYSLLDLRRLNGIRGYLGKEGIAKINRVIISVRKLYIDSPVNKVTGPPEEVKGTLVDTRDVMNELSNLAAEKRKRYLSSFVD